MTAVGRPESFADGFPHDLSVRNPGVAVIQRGKSRVAPEKSAERPLHTYCGRSSLATSTGRLVPIAVTLPSPFSWI